MAHLKIPEETENPVRFLCSMCGTLVMYHEYYHFYFRIKKIIPMYVDVWFH